MSKLDPNLVKGLLLGVAVGDALGAPLEFMSAEEIQEKHGEVRDMLGGGWLNLAKGEVTDDTEMTLLVANGILQFPSCSVDFVGELFRQWLETKPKDVGITCETVIKQTKRSFPRQEEWFRFSEKYHQESGGESAGNGALMRIAFPTVYFPPDEAVIQAVNLGKMTHWHEESTLAITCYTQAVAELARIKSSASISYRKARLEHHMKPIRDLGEKLGKNSNPPPTGYVIDTLLCALNCIRETKNLEEAVVKAVNLGGDADTIGAICGSLAGCIYGESAIPERWKSALDSKVFDQMIQLSALAVEKEKWTTKKLYQMKPFPLRKISKNREVVERIFKLYLVFLACEVTTYPEIFQRIAYSSYKMFQRDLKTLVEAQLLDMMYDKKRGGYVHQDEWGKFLGLDEKNQEQYNCILNPHIENPDKTIAQVYRLVDLLWYYPDDKVPDMLDLLYFNGDEVEAHYPKKIKVPTHSPFIEEYLQEHPELSKEEIYEDMETFIRLGEDFDFDTEVRSFREEVEQFQKEFMPVNLYWDTGEPIDQNSNWDVPYFICDWWFWHGSPCELSEGTIPKEKWVKVRGHDWNKE